MSDYVLLFINSSMAQDNPQAALTLFILALARLLPIIAQCPFFGAKVLPGAAKVALAMSIFFILLPQLVNSVTTPLSFGPMLYFLFAKELFIGYAMGLILSVPFSIVSNAGIIIDHQRGGASLMVNDPTIQNQSSPLGTMFNMVLIYIYYYIDGPFYAIDAIASSYELVPPDRLLNRTFFNQANPFWQEQLKLFNQIMVITTQLAAPALIAILMTDVFLGIANRLAPQVQITFLGMPLKSLLALTVICIGWKAFNKEVVVQVFKWFHVLKESIHALTFGGTPVG